MTLPMPELVLVGVVSPSATLDVVFEISSPRPEDVQPSLDRVVSAFAQAGLFGGYVLPSAAPERSRLSLEPSVVRPGELHCRLQAELVDPRAFQILRNTIARLQMEDIHIRRITVRELGDHNRKRFIPPVPDEDNEDEIYPEISTRLGFEVDAGEIPVDKSRRCLVEYAQLVEAEHVVELAKRVDAWFEVVEEGGWSLPLGHPTEMNSLRGGVCQFDEVTAEISAFCFRASDEAWNVLANLLGAYAKQVAPVTKVIID
jgi:hypothetical protein